ncbi:MAG: mannosyltransferase [Myxococcaceae bacterium]|nr:mannosyltransferase [Myxococcaceae bacterium]
MSLIPALLAVFQLGRLHPDEVYQHLEPANFKAFGYGIMAWEWQQGLRNWAVPGFFAYLLKAADAVGIHDAQARRAVLEVPQWALHVAMLLAVYRLCRRRLEHLPSLAGTALVGLYGPVLGFGGRTLGESLSTAFMVIALERLDDKDAKGTVAMLAGALLGLAVVTRYGSAVVVLAAMASLLVMRRFKHFGWAALGGGVVALALGALDKASWGTWFHSLIEYSKFNVFSQQAAQRFGANPWYFYLPFLGMVPLWVWPALKHGWKQRSQLSLLFLVSAVVYALAISFTSHKEARFLYPALVLLAVGVVPALIDGLQRLGQKWRPIWLYAVALAASVALFFIPTPFGVERPEMYRLVVKGGREATGLFIIPEGIWGAPGFFYLGKNIPWFTCDFPADPRFQQAVRSPVFNRVVSVDGHGEKELLAAGFKELAQDGNTKLFGR